MKRLLALLMALTMILTCLSACGEKKEEPAADTAAAFKLGCTGPLTGGAAIYGNSVKQGAQVAVDELNALGGLQLDFNIQDDTHDAEKAVNAYNNLKDWGMQLMLGSVTSTPAEATAAEAYNDRIFFLTPSASSPNVTEGKDNIFQMCFTDPNLGMGAATYIAENMPGSRIAIIWKNDDSYSTGIRETFVNTAAQLGLEIVDEETFTDATSTDFTVQIANCSAAGADLVFLPMYYTPASLIFNQADAAGYAPLWFGVDGMDGILTLEGFDTSLAEGVVVLTPFAADAQDEKTVSFVTRYKEAYGETPDQFAADAYDSVVALYQALTETGCTADMSAEQLCDTLKAYFTEMSFDGVTGTGMTWSAAGEVSKSPNAVVIQDGAYVGL